MNRNFKCIHREEIDAIREDKTHFVFLLQALFQFYFDLNIALYLKDR